MAEEKLPRGYHISDGKQADDGVTHPKGVIVGPSDSTVKEKTFTCRVCGNTFTATTETAVCNGLNTKVDEGTGRTFNAEIGKTEVLSSNDVRLIGHSPEIMEAE